MTKQEQEQFKAMQEQLANKDKVIADQQKQIADSTKVVERATESPVMYMDVWNSKMLNQIRELENKHGIHIDLESFNGTARREYTLEELYEMVEDAKANEGICCRSYKFQGASNQTRGAVWSGQVYKSHCMTYEQDNAEKSKAGTTYRVEQFSRNIDGVNVFKSKPKQTRTAPSA